MNNNNECTCEGRVGTYESSTRGTRTRRCLDCHGTVSIPQQGA